MGYTKTYKYFYFIALILVSNTVFAQSGKQQKMDQLNFLVGEWVGTTKVFTDGVVTKEGAAYENIAYDLDRSILVINLNTPFLQLHTIITYDEDNRKYYYHRFSKDGAAIYPAEFRDGQLIVHKDEKTRFFFTSSEDGGFLEYGEQLIDGAWTRYFEDRFINTQ